MNEVQDAEWRGGVNAKLDVLISQLTDLSVAKKEDHRELHSRIDRTNTRVDLLESKWDRLFGAAIGIGIGAGAVGGGIGALVSNLIGG